MMKLITPPATEPVSLDETLTHLREPVGQDVLIESLIKAARQHIESLCGPLVSQVWEQYADSWPVGGVIEIEKARLLTVVSVKYTDSAGVEHTLVSTDYLVDTVAGRIVLKDGATWPSDELAQVNPIAVRFTCGFSEVPEPIRIAIMMQVEQMFDGTDQSVVVDALIANYREYGF
jgi:uncharacterized phiE125 gp8 family phage protein